MHLYTVFTGRSSLTCQAYLKIPAVLTGCNVRHFFKEKRWFIILYTLYDLPAKAYKSIPLASVGILAFVHPVLGIDMIGKFSLNLSLLHQRQYRQITLSLFGHLLVFRFYIKWRKPCLEPVPSFFLGKLG